MVMIELLAVPAHGTPPVTLSDWAEALKALGESPQAFRDDMGLSWLELPDRKVRGLVEIEEGHVEAIDFDLPPGQRPLLERAAKALNWELHEDEDEDEEEDEDGPDA